jgi:hypothetical protein
MIDGSYGIRKCDIKITFDGMSCPLNFVKIYWSKVISRELKYREGERSSMLIS